MSQDYNLMLEPKIKISSSLMVKQMADDRILKEPVFTFTINTCCDSFVSFGKPDLSDTSEVAELTMNEDFFWSTYLQGVAFDNPETHPE